MLQPVCHIFYVKKLRFASQILPETIVDSFMKTLIINFSFFLFHFLHFYTFLISTI
nr:MAG TPA: hypothetical protein [Caudoviricetes sp.]